MEWKDETKINTFSVLSVVQSWTVRRHLLQAKTKC